MTPPPASCSRASASLSWSPQSQRREPNTSPVRQAECRRTGTGLEKSGVPTITATESSPSRSRNTTKRVRTPEVSGTWASPAMVSDRVASARKRATALASTVTSDGLCEASALAEVSATSTAGRDLRELDQLDGSTRGLAGRLRQEGVIGDRFGRHRQDLTGLDIVHDLERHGLIGVDAERTRPKPGEHQPRHDRCAERPERREPWFVQPFDRQAEQALAAAVHDDRTAPPETRPAPDQRPLAPAFRTKQNRRPLRYRPSLWKFTPGAPQRSRLITLGLAYPFPRTRACGTTMTRFTPTSQGLGKPLARWTQEGSADIRPELMN